MVAKTIRGRREMINGSKIKMENEDTRGPVNYYRGKTMNITCFD
jgi:hypothetical protein